MTKFIKLTSVLSGKTARIAVDQIFAYIRAADNDVETEILGSDRTAFLVKESPEEIDELVRDRKDIEVVMTMAGNDRPPRRENK